MRKILFYLACLIAVFIIPVSSSDVGKLQPIESVFLYTDNKQVILQTDTGDLGKGDTVQQALKNLKDTTPALAYLDTARYLIVHENALEYADQMGDILKRNVRVCKTNSNIDPAEAADYLRVHSDIPKLKDWKPGNQLPLLLRINDRFILS